MRCAGARVAQMFIRASRVVHRARRAPRPDLPGRNVFSSVSLRSNTRSIRRVLDNWSSPRTPRRAPRAQIPHGARENLAAPNSKRRSDDRLLAAATKVSHDGSRTAQLDQATSLTPTRSDRATSAGHELIGHYQNYGLLEYEEAHAEDITTRHTEVTSERRRATEEGAEGAEGAKEEDAARRSGPVRSRRGRFTTARGAVAKFA